MNDNMGSGNRLLRAILGLSALEIAFDWRVAWWGSLGTISLNTRRPLSGVPCIASSRYQRVAKTLRATTSRLTAGNSTGYQSGKSGIS